MWYPANANVFLSLFSCGEKRRTQIQSASACYVVAILKESYFQWLMTRFRCFSLFYSSVALTFESVHNHSNKRCTLPLYSTAHHRHLVYVF